jgi:hypothetical protein
LADEVVADEAVLAAAVPDDALAEVDEAGDEAAVDRLTATGFSTVAVEAADEMLRICMALPPKLRLISPKSFFGRFVSGFRGKFSLQVIARARRGRGCNEAQRAGDGISRLAGHAWKAIPTRKRDSFHSSTK